MINRNKEHIRAAEESLHYELKFALPHPISCLHRLRVSRHEPSARVAWSFRYAEGVVRFMALVGVADALPRVSAKNRDKILECLKNSSFGKMIWLLKNVAEFESHKGPFLHEIRGLTDDWWVAVQSMNERRNRYAHDDLHLSDGMARRMAPEIEATTAVISDEILFLRDYRLGVFLSARVDSEGVSAQWYASRGLEETESPVEVHLEEAPEEGAVALVDARDGRSVRLDPIFVYDECPADGRHHFFWLNRQIDSDLWNFRHPSECWEVNRPFASVSDANATCSTSKSRRRPPRILAADVIQLRGSQGPLFPQRYRVVGRLGSGGAGTVWEAFDTELNRKCAIKVLNPQQTVSPDARLRFKREARILASLHHPGIVQAFSHERTSSGSDAIVMELCEGVTLDEKIRTEGRLDLRFVSNVVRDVLEALSAAHTVGVIHRDVKPSNIMLTSSGARLIDFGVASSIEHTGITRTGQVVGTAGFIAPEYVAGVRPSAGMDVYAVGRTWIAALSGYEARQDRVVSLLEDVDCVLAAVLRRALDPDPEKRYPDANAMFLELRSCNSDPAGPKFLRTKAGARVDAGMRTKTTVDAPAVDRLPNAREGGGTPPWFAALRRHARVVLVGLPLLAVGVFVGAQIVHSSLGAPNTDTAVKQGIYLEKLRKWNAAAMSNDEDALRTIYSDGWVCFYLKRMRGQDSVDELLRLRISRYGGFWQRYAEPSVVIHEDPATRRVRVSFRKVYGIDSGSHEIDAYLTFDEAGKIIAEGDAASAAKKKEPLCEGSELW